MQVRQVRQADVITTPLCVGDEVRVVGGGECGGRVGVVVALCKCERTIRLQMLDSAYPGRVQLWEGRVELLSAVEQLGRIVVGD